MKIIGAIAKNEWGWDREKLIIIIQNHGGIKYLVFGYRGSAKAKWGLKEKQGQVKSTPKEYVYEESDIESLSVTAKRKAVTMYEKVMRMLEKNPLRKTATKRIGLRLKKKEAGGNNQGISARKYVVKTWSEKSSPQRERSFGWTRVRSSLKKHRSKEMEMRKREWEKKKIVEEMIKRSWNPECTEIYIYIYIYIYRWFGRRGNKEQGTEERVTLLVIRTRNG